MCAYLLFIMSVNEAIPLSLLQLSTQKFILSDNQSTHWASRSDPESDSSRVPESTPQCNKMHESGGVNIYLRIKKNNTTAALPNVLRTVNKRSPVRDGEASQRRSHRDLCFGFIR